MKIYLQYPTYQKFVEESFHGGGTVRKFELSTGLELYLSESDSSWPRANYLKITILGFGLLIAWNIPDETFY